MDDANPYQAPRNLDAEAPLPRDHGAGSQKLLWLGWLPVFLLNLAVPLLLAWQITVQNARAGMFLAAAALFLLGGAICAWIPKFGRTVVTGGVVVGILQIIPILQFMAGTVALAVADSLGQVQDTRELMFLPSLAGGFLVTLMTGILLMAASWIIGLLLVLFRLGRWRNRHV